MKKFTLLLSAIVFSLAGLQAQTLPYNDDFESYTVGGFLAAQNDTWWTTWSNAPGGSEDGEISAAFANSGTQSVLLDAPTSTTASDLVLKLGNKTTGKYELKWMMYLETGKCGYYNIQHTEAMGVEWAFEIYFRTSGAGELYAGSTTAVAFTYPKDTWFEVKHLIDLDADNIKLYVNGTLVNEWPISYQNSSTTGMKQLGGVDFYAGAASGSSETPKYFIDDVTYQVMPTVLLLEDMEPYNVDSYLAVNNPTWFTTWSNNPGSGEDAIIKDTYSHSTSKSALIDETGGSTDLILKLGNKTTGKYELSWWNYVETGKYGYYNMQHTEAPGTEWAFDVFFLANGNGELYAGSSTAITFTYPKDTWFQVKHLIDLDADNIKLYVNDVLVNEWPISYQNSSTAGLKQLGGIDFYAGGLTGGSPTYYLDDVYFAQLGAPSDPIIEVNPTSMAAWLEPGMVQTQQLTVMNTGASALDYEVNIIYPGDKKDNIAVNTPSHTLQYPTGCSSETTNGGSPATDANYVLHYDGDNTSAIGWSSVPITATVAARFPNALALPYAGMFIESVDVYINDLNTSASNEMTLKIWGMGDDYGPGDLLWSQTFTPSGTTWEHLILSSPLLVTGEDLWVGYTFTQSETGIYMPGCDAGPNDPNGDFISTGVGWSHLSNNPDLPYNWNIRANLTGDMTPQWLVVNPLSGSIDPAWEQVLEVNFVATDLAAGVYNGIIRILSNDPVTPQLDVPCTLSIGVGVNENDKVGVMIYPNPAKDRLNIVTDDQLVKVTILSLNGKVVYTGEQSNIDISSLPEGVYTVKAQTLKAISNIKFVKK